MFEFTGFPSIARLRRDCVISEKIDGTNAAVYVEELNSETDYSQDKFLLAEVKDETQVFDTYYGVMAQSRKRLITPQDDNFGFARWVQNNAEQLAKTLGPGLHFGEWWGSGIQRGYGLTKGEKRFSLFNTARWKDVDFSAVQGLGVVPELFVGEFSTENIDQAKAALLEFGSVASPGFDRPEGIVVYHTASKSLYKVTYGPEDSYEWGPNPSKGV
jgi:hypothetical protein